MTELHIESPEHHAKLLDPYIHDPGLKTPWGLLFSTIISGLGFGFCIWWFLYSIRGYLNG